MTHNKKLFACQLFIMLIAPSICVFCKFCIHPSRSFCLFFLSAFAAFLHFAYLPMPFCVLVLCNVVLVVLVHVKCCAESCNLTEVLIILLRFLLLMMHIFVSKNNSWNMFLANSVWSCNNNRHRQVQQCLLSPANILYQHFIFTDVSNNEEG